MPPPRDRHVRPRLSVDRVLRDDAPQIRVPGGPPRARNNGGDSASFRNGNPGPSRGPSRSPPCQEHVAEPASAQTLQEPDAPCLKNSLGTTTLKESSITATSSAYPQAVAHDTMEVSPSAGRSALGSPILVWRHPDWYFTFYIRIDLSGSFHTYPDLGGPFRSLKEAENALNRHLDDLRHPTMRKESLDQLSTMDRIIRKSMYWPDGTRKKPSKSRASDPMRLLVQALLDQYNEDHNLSVDLAYGLKDVLCQQYFISEGHSYQHVNFTTKTKGADDFDSGINNLFFAEVKLMPGYKEMVVSCFCMVKPNDNGHCYGCKNNGSADMKHPNKADAYSRGHVDEYLPFGGVKHWSDSDEDEEAEEKKLRRMYEGLDDPRFLAKIFPNYVTPTVQTKKCAGVED